MACKATGRGDIVSRIAKILADALQNQERQQLWMFANGQSVEDPEAVSELRKLRLVEQKDMTLTELGHAVMRVLTQLNDSGVPFV